MSRPAYFAIAARGTESVLADEFNALGIAPVAIERGGVRFGTNLEDGYRACLWSRIASRILTHSRPLTHPTPARCTTASATSHGPTISNHDERWPLMSPVRTRRLALDIS